MPRIRAAFNHYRRPKLRIFRENSYLLLMSEYNIIMTLKPQGVDEPGV